MGGDKRKSEKEAARGHSPHPQRGRVLNPNNPPELPAPEEQPPRRGIDRLPLPRPLREGLRRLSPRRHQEPEARRPTSPHPVRDRRLRNVPAGAAIGGPDDDSFQRARDRAASPHPGQNDKIGPVPGGPGARRPGFGVSEGVATAGAVGGSIASVDVHPHGEISRSQHDQEHDNGNDEDAESIQLRAPAPEPTHERNGRLRSFFRNVSNRVRDIASMVLPSGILGPRDPMLLPIPEPQPPEMDDESTESHPSLASGSLDLPDLESSSTDSETVTVQVKPASPPSTPDSEEGADRRAASAPAVLETSRDSDHLSDDEEFQNVEQSEETRTPGAAEGTTVASEETAATAEGGPSMSSLYYMRTAAPAEIHVGYEETGHVTTCISFDTPPDVYGDNARDIDES